MTGESLYNFNTKRLQVTGFKLISNLIVYETSAGLFYHEYSIYNSTIKEMLKEQTRVYDSIIILETNSLFYILDDKYGSWPVRPTTILELTEMLL